MSTTHEQHLPTATTALAGILSLVAIGFFLREVPALFPAVVGITGALCLTASLWVVDNRQGPVAKLVTSVLSIPVAAGFVVGIFGTTLLLIGSFFPVENVSQVSVATLIVLGNLGIVAGTAITTFGVSLGVKDVTATKALTEYTRTAVATAVVPLATGFVLLVGIAATTDSPAGGGLLSQTHLGTLWATLVAPAGPQLHLSSFLIVTAVTAGVWLLLIRRLPFESLVDSWRDEAEDDGGVVTILHLPQFIFAVAMGILPIALFVEILLPASATRSFLSTPLYSLVRTVTTAGWLRIVLLATATVGGLWLGATVLLDRDTPERPDSSPEWFVPPGVGVVVTILAAIFSEPTFQWLVTEVTSQLPPEPASQAVNVVGHFVTVYGTTPVMLLIAGLFMGVPAVIGSILLGTVQLKYLTAEGTGFSIACGGLILAAISASIVSAPTWLILGGIAVALAVWDIGHFGMRLGHEVGTGSTTQLVVIRATVTLLVGLAGVVLAVGLQRWLSMDGLGLSSVTTLALVLLITALVAFANALR